MQVIKSTQSNEETNNTEPKNKDVSVLSNDKRMQDKGSSPMKGKEAVKMRYMPLLYMVNVMAK